MLLKRNTELYEKKSNTFRPLISKEIEKHDAYYSVLRFGSRKSE